MAWRTDYDGRETLGGARVARFVREEILTIATGLAEKLQEADPEGWAEAIVNGTREEQVRRRLDSMPDATDLQAALPPRFRLADELNVNTDGWDDFLLEDATDEEAVEALEENIIRGLGRSRDEVEVLEWWIVSDFAGKALEEHGEVVVSYADTRFWGRETSGQTIVVDGIIQDLIAGFADAGEDLDAPLRPELSAAALSAWLREQIEKEQTEALTVSAKQPEEGKRFDVLHALDMATGRRQAFDLVLAHIGRT